MKRVSAIALVTILIVICAAPALAQGPPPTPAPELKKLDYFVGTWKSEGELKPGPMGPGGKFTELGHNSWMPGKFFLVEHTNVSGAMGHLVEIAYLGYSAEDKVYTYDAFNSMGEAEHAKGTVQGDTWTWTSTEKMGGQTMKGRFTITVASPTSYSFKFEIAAEGGGDYTTVVEGKSTKMTAAKTATGAEGAAAKK
jgi:hypothetical protein